MNRVRRAIILAAGIGKRMQPLTLTVPKPLVTVNGERMIDTVIKGLQSQGIQEIHIVVGYKKESFEILTRQYKGIDLIENPFYDSCNNISSLYVAREFLSESIILDGDQIIYNDKVLATEFERSGYNAVYTDEETGEWLLDVDKGGIVRSCSRTGGSHGWQLYSVSRWTQEDGERLKKHLEEEFIERENRMIYWDDVALFCHPEEYQLGVYPMQKGDVVEIDDLKELCKVDPSYKKFVS